MFEVGGDTRTVITEDLHPIQETMANYRYSHFDDFGNLKPRPDTTQVNRDPESSHEYGVPLFSSAAPQSDSTITYPDTLRSESGGCQYDDRESPDFRPYTAYHSDNTGLLDLHVHPLSGLIRPPTASDFAAEIFPSLYTPRDDQYELRNSNSKILYVNNPDTGELKSYQVLSQPKKQLQQVAPNPERTENIGRFSDGSDPPPMLRDFLPTFSVPHFTTHDMDTRALYTSHADVTFRSEVDMERASTLTLLGYCDCFANGEYCLNCNCTNCFNNIYHEYERERAIKRRVLAGRSDGGLCCMNEKSKDEGLQLETSLVYLYKNPEAFQPKIGRAKTGYVIPRHTKGCNCKRSGCRKNYCACYEAKILCSTMCKCITCKNYEESPDSKYLRNKQQYADMESILRTCSSIEVVRATCSCLLARAEIAEREQFSAKFAEQMIIEEFGKCLEQILQKDPQ
ncbi:tesmin isoform X2 [Ranitomeya variabilis]|uniref:tesmin isoform X2 n=1 Tax=Ranitomeya variabilis TaxID=490064 RepID=UPI0040560CAB